MKIYKIGVFYTIADEGTFQNGDGWESTDRQEYTEVAVPTRGGPEEAFSAACETIKAYQERQFNKNIRDLNQKGKILLGNFEMASAVILFAGHLAPEAPFKEKARKPIGRASIEMAKKGKKK